MNPFRAIKYWYWERKYPPHIMGLKMMLEASKEILTPEAYKEQCRFLESRINEKEKS